MMPTGCSKSLSLGAWMVASLLLEDFTLQLRCGRTWDPWDPELSWGRWGGVWWSMVE